MFCHISSHALPFQHDVFSSLSNSGKVLICVFLNELLLIRDEISVHKGRAESSASLCLFNIHSYNTKPYPQVYISLLDYIFLLLTFYNVNTKSKINLTRLFESLFIVVFKMEFVCSRHLSA